MICIGLFLWVPLILISLPIFILYSVGFSLAASVELCLVPAISQSIVGLGGGGGVGVYGAGAFLNSTLNGTAAASTASAAVAAAKAAAAASASTPTVSGSVWDGAKFSFTGANGSNGTNGTNGTNGSVGGGIESSLLLECTLSSIYGVVLLLMLLMVPAVSAFQQIRMRLPNQTALLYKLGGARFRIGAVKEMHHLYRAERCRIAAKRSLEPLLGKYMAQCVLEFTAEHWACTDQAPPLSDAACTVLLGRPRPPVMAPTGPNGLAETKQDKFQDAGEAVLRVTEDASADSSLRRLAARSSPIERMLREFPGGMGATYKDRVETYFKYGSIAEYLTRGPNSDAEVQDEQKDDAYWRRQGEAVARRESVLEQVRGLGRLSKHARNFTAPIHAIGTRNRTHNRTAATPYGNSAVEDVSCGRLQLHVSLNPGSKSIWAPDHANMDENVAVASMLNRGGGRGKGKKGKTGGKSSGMKSACVSSSSLLLDLCSTWSREGGGESKGGNVDDVDEVRDLIARGVNIDEQNQHGTTALMYAVMCDRLEMVQVLIRAGATLDLQDLRGATALQLARTVTRTKMITVLLEEAEAAAAAAAAGSPSSAPLTETKIKESAVAKRLDPEMAATEAAAAAAAVTEKMNMIWEADWFAKNSRVDPAFYRENATMRGHTTEGIDAIRELCRLDMALGLAQDPYVIRSNILKGRYHGMDGIRQQGVEVLIRCNAVFLTCNLWMVLVYTN